MQYCSNRTLRDYLEQPSRRNSVDKGKSLNLFLQIAHGVQYVHERGLIHRDLKPSNVFLIGEDGNTVKIGDFGLSRHVNTIDDDKKKKEDKNSDERRERTYNRILRRQNSFKTGNTAGVGTYMYASPEQLRGRDYDEKSDVFSLGIILFELFHPAFTTNMERTVKVRNLHEGRIDEDFKKSNENLVPLLEQMLNKDPTARPAVADVVERLRFLQGRPLVLPYNPPTNRRVRSNSYASSKEKEKDKGKHDKEKGRDRINSEGRDMEVNIDDQLKSSSTPTSHEGKTTKTQQLTSNIDKMLKSKPNSDELSLQEGGSEGEVGKNNNVDKVVQIDESEIEEEEYQDSILIRALATEKDGVSPVNEILATVKGKTKTVKQDGFRSNNSSSNTGTTDSLEDSCIIEVLLQGSGIGSDKNSFVVEEVVEAVKSLDSVTSVHTVNYSMEY